MTAVAERALLKIERARWWALSEQPFYGSLAMRLTDVIDPGVETACTDGRVIRWNPEWIADKPDEEVRFVLLHETMHPAHQHLWRLPPTKLGNEAGDHVINLTLKTIPGVAMPKGGLADPTYKDLAEEEVLARLTPPPGSGGGSGGSPRGGSKPGPGDASGGSGGGSPGDGGEPGSEGSSDGPGDGPGPVPGADIPDPCGGFCAPAAGDTAPGAVERAAAAQALAETWERAVLQAAQAAQALGRGNLPGDLERELARLRATRIDWKRECSDFVRDVISTRNDWSRCARRHAWQPVIYPRRMRNDIGTVLAARDTSGSIGGPVMAQFTGLLQSLAEELGVRIIVIDCDARVQAEHVVEPGEPIPERAVGGGGTDFRPVFERADELTERGESIAGIVYLTDLYGSEPAEVAYPTLWLATTDRVAGTGRTVRIEGGGA